MKKIILLLVMAIGLVSCNNNQENNQVEVQRTVAKVEKIQVTTSIVPLASITNYIGGESVEVHNLVPAGTSPHGFSLTPQHLINIQKSDIVFLLGIQDIDGFLFKSLSGVKSIALDAGLQVLEGVEHDHSDHEEHSEDGHSEDKHSEHEEDYGEDGHSEHTEDTHSDAEEHDDEEHSEHEEHTAEEHEEEHNDDGDVNKYLAEEGEGHIHAEASIDPHVWTGKVNSLLMAKKIQEELSLLQPSDAAVFEANYQRFEIVLSALFDDFATKIEGKTQKEFIVFHDAYNYLLFDAGIDLEKKLIFRANVMNDPSSAKMKELVDEVKLHGLKNFFTEPQFESKALQILAEENGATIETLDPLGSSTDAENFLENVSSNLEALSKIYE